MFVMMKIALVQLVMHHLKADRKRNKKNEVTACVAQLVEHFLGKEEVIGSIPIASSK